MSSDDDNVTSSTLSLDAVRSAPFCSMLELCGYAGYGDPSGAAGADPRALGYGDLGAINGKRDSGSKKA